MLFGINIESSKGFGIDRGVIVIFDVFENLRLYWEVYYLNWICVV